MVFACVCVAVYCAFFQRVCVCVSVLLCDCVFFFFPSRVGVCVCTCVHVAWRLGFFDLSGEM